MIAKNREDRFENAGDLVGHIREMRDKAERASRAALDAQANVTKAPNRLVGTLIKNKRVLALAAMVLIILGAYGGFYYYIEVVTVSTFTTRSLPTDGNSVSMAEPTNSDGQDQSATGAQREDVIKALEWLAHTRLSQDMLTEPPADNAHYYSRLLELDEKRARAGFIEIAERFVMLVEKEFSHENYRQAQTYVTLGLQVQPNNEGLRTLQSFIDTRDRSVLENLLDFFTGSG